jgi:dipeptidyl aminopeptidase/acylaminoacyl peptidase
MLLGVVVNLDWIKNMKQISFRLIPRSVLFALPDKSMVKISPDGTLISYLGLFDGVQNIITMPVGDITTFRRLTLDSKRNISSYTWTYTPNFMVYAQDNDGDENYVLYLLDINTLQAVQITPGGTRGYVAAVSADRPQEIIFMVNDRNPSYFDVYKYNLVTKNKELIFTNDEYLGFTFDSNLNIRFGTKILSSGAEEIYEFDTEDFKTQKPKLFKTIPFEDTDTTGIIGMNQDGDKLYMLSSVGKNYSELHSLDLTSGQEIVIGKSDCADVSGVLLHPKTYEVEGYSYHYTRLHNVLINHDLQQDYELLKAEHEGDISIISRSHNDALWIVAYGQDTGPIRYYLYSRKNKKLKFLFVHNVELSGLELNPMQPVTITARDGLKMVSYLSVPENMWKDKVMLKVKGPMPLVLYVHGGPNARDFWGYDSVHQWLTNRGYAVLSVNYRGSTGFGKEFIRAGDGQWAAKMHEDLLDAVDWALEHNIAVKEQIAIFGGSYGGYAALVGLTMTPEVFACGVDIVGPSNLKTLYESIPPYWEPFRASLKRKFGFDPENPKDVEKLQQKSPLFHVHNISKPILIAQGANDPRVKQAESDQIVAKMHASDIPYTYLLFPDEGHGFKKPCNRMSFYGFAEQFLAECMGKEEYEPLGSELIESKVKVNTNIVPLESQAEESPESSE